MSNQDLFEKDYLAAFPVAVASQHNLFEKDSDGDYWSVKACAAFGVWLQQAKRHEAEEAELVAILKGFVNDVHTLELFERAKEVIFKHEVNKS